MDFTSLKLSVISAFYFNQKSADPLYSMLETYSGYSHQIRKSIQFVLIDDCSTIPVKLPTDLPLNYQLLRVQQDIPWNNGGARNLGVVHARTSKILLTDIEQIFPEKLLKKILEHRERKSVFYKFKRVDSTGKRLTTPRNLLYMTKSVFFNALGYDEAFCGNYGFEDSFLIDSLKQRNNSFRYFTRFVKVIERKVDRENAYHSFSRDTTVNAALLENKQARMKQDVLNGHSRLFLNFDWEKIDERMNANENE